jgi:hypothetical protein
MIFRWTFISGAAVLESQNSFLELLDESRQKYMRNHYPPENLIEVKKVSPIKFKGGTPPLIFYWGFQCVFGITFLSRYQGGSVK